MIVRVVCTDSKCSKSERVDTDNARAWLRAHGQFGFGARVKDERAFAMRMLVCKGWRHLGREPGKSTISMRCHGHGRDVIATEADAVTPLIPDGGAGLS